MLAEVVKEDIGSSFENLFVATGEFNQQILYASRVRSRGNRNP